MKNRILFLSLITPFLLTACAPEQPTWVTPAKMDVHAEGFDDTFDTAALDPATLRAIGVNYYRYGNGPMDVSVSYDPQSKTNTAAHARAQADRIGKELARNGVHNARISSAALTSSGDKSTTRIAFPALTARPPASCGMMPGYVDRQTNLPETGEGEPKSYQIGCTVESLMAKQIARPGDLMGRPGFETNADATRQERVIWTRGYYGDKSFPPIEGETATDGN